MLEIAWRDKQLSLSQTLLQSNIQTLDSIEEISLLLEAIKGPFEL